MRVVESVRVMGATASSEGNQCRRGRIGVRALEKKEKTIHRGKKERKRKGGEVSQAGNHAINRDGGCRWKKSFPERKNN